MDIIGRIFGTFAIAFIAIYYILDIIRGIRKILFVRALHRVEGWEKIRHTNGLTIFGYNFSTEAKKLRPKYYEVLSPQYIAKKKIGSREVVFGLYEINSMDRNNLPWWNTSSGRPMAPNTFRFQWRFSISSDDTSTREKIILALKAEDGLFGGGVGRDLTDGEVVYFLHEKYLDIISAVNPKNFMDTFREQVAIIESIK